MRKILPIAFASILISCSPYQRLVFSPSNLSAFLNDSCDVRIINRLKQVIDTAGIPTMNNPDQWLEEIAPDSCTFYACEIFYAPERNSSSWLLTIRPAYVGKDEIIIGNLYTLYPTGDSSLAFVRRIKEYSQTESFESGEYLGFTYILENDSITTIKIGTRRF